MKIVLPTLIAAAGVWLGFVALRAREPSYVSPAVRVPVRIESEVRPGRVLRGFDVEGMCCESCTRKLYGALLDVEGVSEAAVDLEAETVWAVAPRALPVERLLEALHFEEYSAVARE
ncbi:MAG: heavy metal-associated domain-containing protein [Planctomycetota bacterium]|jgi:copper chaperone CopZ|nr:heavy metal-associated domain-containing protein [Planctomycetota bacterium]